MAELEGFLLLGLPALSLRVALGGGGGLLASKTNVGLVAVSALIATLLLFFASVEIVSISAEGPGGGGYFRFSLFMTQIELCTCCCL